MRASISVSEETSTGTEMSVMTWREASRARLKALMMTTGWMFRSRRGREWARISPAGGRSRARKRVSSSLEGRSY